MDSLHHYDSGDGMERKSKSTRKRDASYDAADSDGSRSRSRYEKEHTRSRRPSNGRRQSDDRGTSNHRRELSEESRASSSIGSQQPESKRQSESKKSSANPFAVDTPKADKARHDDEGRDRSDRHSSKGDHRSSSSKDRDRSSKSSKNRDEERGSNRDRKRSHRDEEDYRRDHRSDKDRESSKSSSSRRDRDRDHKKDTTDKHRGGGSSRHKSDRRDRDSKRSDTKHRSQSKERNERRERSRSHEPRDQHDKPSHTHSNHRASTTYSKPSLVPNHLISRQERDAQKAEQLKKMGIEYGVAGSGCNGNSVNLAAAYAVQQAILLSNQNQQKKIPALMSLGVTNPNAPTETALPTILAPSAVPTVGSLQLLTNFAAPSILASARYTEQMQKRKQLWSHKKAAVAPVADTPVAPPPPTMTMNKWEETRFSQDNDGKVASKFLRLMGMKDVPAKSCVDDTTEKPSSGGGVARADPLSKQNEMFNTMEHQYEVARQVTHTMRGMGLGFSSQPRPF